MAPPPLSLSLPVFKVKKNQQNTKYSATNKTFTYLRVCRLSSVFCCSAVRVLNFTKSLRYRTSHSSSSEIIPTVCKKQKK